MIINHNGDQPSAYPADMAGQNPQHTKRWHYLVGQDLRNHLIKKLIQAIYPSPHPLALLDKKMCLVVGYAKKIEEQTYQMANSRMEYYQEMSEKIYKIYTKVEEKRKQPAMENAQNAPSQSTPVFIPRPPAPSPLLDPFHGITPTLVASAASIVPPANQVTPPTKQVIPVPYAGQSGGINGTITKLQSTIPPFSPFHIPESHLLHSNSLPVIPSSSQVTVQTIPIREFLLPRVTPMQQQQQVHVPSTSEVICPLTSEIERSRSNQTISSNTESGESEISSTQHVGDAEPCNQTETELEKVEPMDVDNDTEDEDVHEAGICSSGIITANHEDIISTSGMDPVRASINVPTSGNKNNVGLKRDDMKSSLLQILDRLYHQNPECLPFLQPVDPRAQGVPNYFTLVKKPMDLSTIKKKVNSESYGDPWEFIDDIWLMFDNAWLINKKNSRVSRCATKLSQVFEDEVDSAMKNMGYCCGRRYTFTPQTFCCQAQDMCIIQRDATYFSFDNRYHYCPICFNAVPGETINLDDATISESSIRKDQFVEMKNDHVENEPFVDCTSCQRKFHQICVLHMESIWPEGYTCENCLKENKQQRKENAFTAKKLPETKLGSYIETRVNNFLTKKEAGAGNVYIRVVAITDKVAEVKPEMKKRFVDTGSMNGSFPYKAKALFAFEEIDGTEVCFFGMHVQEYGSDCPSPNTRRVYLAYLDSVHYFRPKEFRSAVYHEIILGYLEYVKQIGFTTAHIWASPPLEGDDYIFYCHPPQQKIPKVKRLQEWYKKMLDRGIIERVVLDYNDILRQAIQDNVSSPTDIPYFEGDFWLNIMEESIKEQGGEETKNNDALPKIDELLVNNDGRKTGQGMGKKIKINGWNNNNKFNGDDISKKIMSAMEKHKESFFVVRLHSDHSAASLPAVHDPDPLISCDFMDGREGFLTLARENRYEFSSLRRAKFSTMAMLYELHNQGRDEYTYTCNVCKDCLKNRYHCTFCEDFDLCHDCFQKNGHPHKMEKLDAGVENSEGGTCNNADPSLTRNVSIQKCVYSLIHSVQCKDANCTLPSCKKMKHIVAHALVCKRKTKGGCPVCKQLKALCFYHARRCKEKSRCLVPLCANIRQTLQNQQYKELQRQRELLRQRAQESESLPCTSNASQRVVGESHPLNQSAGVSMVPQAPNKPVRTESIPDRRQRLVTFLRTNPRLLATFLRYRQQQLASRRAL